MELKAVNEYETPSYSTYDESRNRFFRSIVSCKKVSIGVLVMVLLYDKVMAVRPQIDMSSSSTEPLGGGPSIIGTFLNIYTLLWDIGILITIVVILCGVICKVKLRKIGDEEEKEEKRKKCNLRVRSAVISSLILPFCIWIGSPFIIGALSLLNISEFMLAVIIFSVIGLILLRIIYILIKHGVEKIQSAFHNSNILESLEVPESVKQIEQSKAFLVGLALGMFKIRTKTDGSNSKTFLFYSPKNTIPAKVTVGGAMGAKEITDSYLELLEAVKYNPQMTRTIMDKYSEELEESNKIIGMTVSNVINLPIIENLCDIYKDSKENRSVIDAIISAYSVIPATEKQSPVTLKKITELIKALESIIEENVAIFALSENQKNEMFRIALEHVLDKSKLVKTLSPDTIEYVYVVEPIKNLLNN